MTITTKQSKPKIELNDVLAGKKLNPRQLPNKSALEKSIEQELENHYTNLQELRRLEEKVKDDNKKIGQLIRQEEKRLERLTKDINLIDGTGREFKLKNVIAKLIIVPKYKSYAPSYKDLWEYTLESVGIRIKKMLQKQERKMINDKVEAKTQVIEFIPIEK